MATPITVRLWGVRGSIPSPGPLTARHGGNTPCVSLELGNEKCLILDAGSGIRLLGKHLANTSIPILVLLTHEHWDHVQGFPFFAPVYEKDRRLVIFPVERGMDMLCTLVAQMDGAHFPVTSNQIPAALECVQADPIHFLAEQGFTMRRHRTNHPGVCYGYRFEHNGKSLIFMPDNELTPPARAHSTMQEFAEFCRGADVLMHDAQFMPSDMPHKRGWGHSVVHETCELAAMAKVKHLILFHHDPDRTDTELDAIQEECRAWFAKNAPDTQVTAGREGMTLTL
jgi:phosphoribosyl 1,2-cyclic phosphodiesterase